MQWSGPAGAAGTQRKKGDGGKTQEGAATETQPNQTRKAYRHRCTASASRKVSRRTNRSKDAYANTHKIGPSIPPPELPDMVDLSRIASTPPCSTYRRVIAGHQVEQQVRRHPPAVALVRPPRLVEVRQKYIEHIPRRRRRRRPRCILGPPAGLHLGRVRHKLIARRPRRRHLGRANDVWQRQP